MATFRSDQAPVEPRLRFSWAATLLGRGRSGDLSQSLQRVQSAFVDADRRELAEAHLLAARAIHRFDPRRGDDLRSHLRALDPGALDFAQVVVYVDLLVEVGLEDLAIANLRQAVREAILERRGTIANHIADDRAAVAQVFSRGLAMRFLARGDAVEAFLALEDTVSLRYYEAPLAASWAPSDAIERALSDRKESLAAAARYLDDLASRQSAAGDPDARDGVADCVSAVWDTEASLSVEAEGDPWRPEERRFEQRRMMERVLEGLQAAANAPSVVTALRRGARDLGDESLRARRWPWKGRGPRSRLASRALKTPLRSPAE